MKKILAILLAAMMLLSVVACGNNNTPDEPNTPDDGGNEPANPDTPANPEDNTDPETPVDPEQPEDPSEPQGPAFDYVVGTPDGNGNLIPAVAEKTTGWVMWNTFVENCNGLMTADVLAEILAMQPYIPFSPMAMPVMPDPEASLFGFDNYQFSNFEMAGMFMPMMSSIPFLGYVFDLAEGADVQAFVNQLAENCNPRWMQCVDADQIVVGAIGNQVFFLMSLKDAITSAEVEAEVIAPEVAEGSNAEAIWNAFEAFMTENPTAFAADAANALAESVFAGTVTEADWSIDHDIFKYGLDGYNNAAYIESEGKTVYVIQLDRGLEIENWTGYVFDGIEAPFGAYDMTILLMVNVD